MPNYGGLECSASYVLSRGFRLDQLMQSVSSLHRISTSHLDGLLYNPLHVILALIGIISLTKRRNEYSTLILVWVIIISIIFPFGNLGVKSRLLLSAPFPLLIAEGLWALSRLLARFDSKLPKLFIIFFIVSSLTYTVRALCNLI